MSRTAMLSLSPILKLSLFGVCASAAFTQSVDVVEERFTTEGIGGFLGTLADGDGWGHSVAALGDLNGDGVEDLAVGSPLRDGGGVDRGSVWVLFMQSDGQVASYQEIGDGIGGLPLTLADGDRFGHALASLPDLNGDGRKELCVSVSGSSNGGVGWPAGTGTELGMGLPAGFEPSGCSWHAGLKRIVVVSDKGDVALMRQNGNVQAVFSVGGDLEGVVVPDPADSICWLGLEDPDRVLEFDLNTGQLTGLSWDLTPWMQGPSSKGLESLACVQGVCYAGLQETGQIFTFDLQPGGFVQHLGTIAPPLGQADLSGLHYETSTDILYAIYDPSDLLLELTPTGEVLRAFPAPSDQQEGITLIPGCPGPLSRMIIADDAGLVPAYANYPTPCDGSRLLRGRGGVAILDLSPSGWVNGMAWITSGTGGFSGSLDAGDFFGSALAGLGDLDGDGTYELAVGAAHDDDGGALAFSQRGAAYILSLDSSFSVTAWSKVSATSGGFGGVLLDGDGFGSSLAPLGDVDGDGEVDLAVGSPFSDAGGKNSGSFWTCMLDGSGTVLGQVEVTAQDLGLGTGGALGTALSPAPGALTSGLPGLLSSSPGGGATGEGALHTLVLAPDGTVKESYSLDGSSGGWQGPLAPGDRVGTALSPAVDVDGDGLMEFLVGAPGSDAAGDETGGLWSLELKRTLGVSSCFADSNCPCGNVGSANAGCTNSTGLGGLLGALGTASVGDDDLTLVASSLPVGQFGILFMGDVLSSPIPMADGLRCAGGKLYRFPARMSDAAGQLTEGPGVVGWTQANLKKDGRILAGSTWSFQCWHRDLAGPCGTGSNVTSALSITFLP